MAETTNTPLTTEQITQVRAEIEELQNKAIQHAASSKTLAAHYTRQYNSAKRFLKTAARAETSAKSREFSEKLKAARGGSAAPASAPNTRNRPTNS